LSQLSLIFKKSNGYDVREQKITDVVSKFGAVIRGKRIQRIALEAKNGRSRQQPHPKILRRLVRLLVPKV
jgi:hypothetical protein